MTTVKKPPPKPVKKPPAKAMTFKQVENVWIQAGGNPQAAAMAAAVADASSGLNPNATFTNPDGSVGIGLWLIDKGGLPPGSTDPLANARAAVQLSKNGRDWSLWCTAWSDNACGKNQGVYLGDGSNALGSLGQKLGPSSYNVIGAAPTGSGTSASTANTTPIQPTQSGSGNKLILVGATLIVAIGIWYFLRKQRNGTAVPVPGGVTTVASENG